MKKSILAFCFLLMATSLFSQHSIGESYGGGIVFYVYDNGQHGLIAAPQDQSTGVKWNNLTNSPVTGAFRNGIGSFDNTALIISKLGWGSNAAMACARYNGAGFSDWYLPSKYELNLMYQNKNVLNNLGVWYWSSTETGWNQAWAQSFASGNMVSTPKANALRARAIRAF